jgi:hypothetical protein
MRPHPSYIIDCLTKNQFALLCIEVNQLYRGLTIFNHIRGLNDIFVQVDLPQNSIHSNDYNLQFRDYSIL